MSDMEHPSAPRTVAYVGAYGDDEHQGGIHAFAVEGRGQRLLPLGGVVSPDQAGFLVFQPGSRTLYAVDERKTDGRGPVQPPAAVHAFRVQPDGRLTPVNTRPALGAYPTYLAVTADPARLLSVSHGSFDHVERVVRDELGWRTEYLYDDSTVVLYDLERDGSIGEVADVQVLEGRGVDPNRSPQAGGHGQASSHAHCAVIDPSGQFVLVADKATDQIHVYRLGASLNHTFTFQAAEETGPRHLAFDVSTGRVFGTYEFSSEVASFDFDAESGRLTQRDVVSSVFSDPGRVNEPADIRVHPSGDVVFVNNRGEDSLAWFGVTESGELHRRGHVSLAPSVHPGLAARSFAISPEGDYLLVADRPGNVVRAYAVSPDDHGSLEPLTQIEVPNAAFVVIVTLDSPEGDVP